MKLLHKKVSLGHNGWTTTAIDEDCSVGQQQNVMAMASMNAYPERDPTANASAGEEESVASERQVDRIDGERRSPGDMIWATACPYCRSRSYRLQHKPLARGLLVEGRCERCGTWGLSQLHTQNPLSGRELVSLEMAASLHVPVERI